MPTTCRMRAWTPSFCPTYLQTTTTRPTLSRTGGDAPSPRRARRLLSPMARRRQHPGPRCRPAGAQHLGAMVLDRRERCWASRRARHGRRRRRISAEGRPRRADGGADTLAPRPPLSAPRRSRPARPPFEACAAPQTRPVEPRASARSSHACPCRRDASAARHRRRRPRARQRQGEAAGALPLGGPARSKAPSAPVDDSTHPSARLVRPGAEAAPAQPQDAPARRGERSLSSVGACFGAGPKAEAPMLRPQS